MKTQTYTKILNYIEQNGNVPIKDIARNFQISPQMAHRHIKKALAENKIIKRGKPPKVFYSLSSKNTNLDPETIQDVQLPHPEIINNHFSYINNEGIVIDGQKGFVTWCKEKSFEPIPYAMVFQSTVNKYESKRDCNTQLFDHSNIKCEVTNKNPNLTCLYYQNCKEYEIFGKTRVYIDYLEAINKNDKSTLYNFLNKIKIKDTISKLIKLHNIDAFAICPSLNIKSRDISKEIEMFLDLNIPIIRFDRIQTSLTSDLESIINNDFVLAKKTNHKKILLFSLEIGNIKAIDLFSKKLNGEVVSFSLFV